MDVLSDVLSEVVTAMRTGRPHSARARRPASFGRRFPPALAAGFHIVVRGSCWLVPAGGAPLALGPGDVAFLPHGTAHGLADSPSTPLPDDSVALPPDQDKTDGTGDTGGTVLLCGAYLLDRSRTHPMLADLPEVIHVSGRTGRHPQLPAAVELLDAELARSRPGSDAMVPALLEILLVQILRAWFDDQATRGVATGWALALRDPAVAAALRAVHRDPDRPWTVEELGARAGLSRAAFARRFSTLVGQPPLGYLTWWRMTLAARLLRDTNAPLAAIARKVGYTSEFAFAHAFKREFGVAPGRFRHTGPPAARSQGDDTTSPGSRMPVTPAGSTLTRRSAPESRSNDQTES